MPLALKRSMRGLFILHSVLCSRLCCKREVVWPCNSQLHMVILNQTFSLELLSEVVLNDLYVTWLVHVIDDLRPD